MTPDEIRRIETSIADMKRDLTAQIHQLSAEVAAASEFQNGFRSVARTLAYVLGIVVALATIYGAVFR